MGRIKRIWYLSPMRAAKVQASLRMRAVSPEPPLLAHIGSESRGTFRQKARSLAPLNGWACAVKICHDGMLEDTHSLDGAQMKSSRKSNSFSFTYFVGLATTNNGYVVISLLIIRLVCILKRLFWCRWFMLIRKAECFQRKTVINENLKSLIQIKVRIK